MVGVNRTRYHRNILLRLSSVAAKSPSGKVQDVFREETVENMRGVSIYGQGWLSKPGTGEGISVRIHVSKGIRTKPGCRSDSRHSTRLWRGLKNYDSTPRFQI